MVREEGQHYSSCLLGMLYNGKPCICSYIDALFAGRRKAEYVEEIAGEEE